MGGTEAVSAKGGRVGAPEGGGGAPHLVERVPKRTCAMSGLEPLARRRGKHGSAVRLCLRLPIRVISIAVENPHHSPPHPKPSLLRHSRPKSRFQTDQNRESPLPDPARRRDAVLFIFYLHSQTTHRFRVPSRGRGQPWERAHIRCLPADSRGLKWRKRGDHIEFNCKKRIFAAICVSRHAPGRGFERPGPGGGWAPPACARPASRMIFALARPLGDERPTTRVMAEGGRRGAYPEPRGPAGFPPQPDSGFSPLRAPHPPCSPSSPQPCAV